MGQGATEVAECFGGHEVAVMSVVQSSACLAASFSRRFCALVVFCRCKLCDIECIIDADKQHAPARRPAARAASEPWLLLFSARGCRMPCVKL